MFQVERPHSPVCVQLVRTCRHAGRSLKQSYRQITAQRRCSWTQDDRLRLNKNTFNQPINTANFNF